MRLCSEGCPTPAKTNPEGWQVGKDWPLAILTVSVAQPFPIAIGSHLEGLELE